MNKEIISKLVQLQKDYAELYNNQEIDLQGVSDNYIQVGLETFKEIFKGNEGAIELEKTGNVELVGHYGDVKFIALL